MRVTVDGKEGDEVGGDGVGGGGYSVVPSGDRRIVIVVFQNTIPLMMKGIKHVFSDGRQSLFLPFRVVIIAVDLMGTD